MSSSRFRTQLILRHGSLRRKPKFTRLASASSTFQWVKPTGRVTRLHRHIRGLWLGDWHEGARAVLGSIGPAR